METEGPRLSLECPSCAVAFEACLPTLASLAFAHFNCPQCGAPLEIWPEDYGAVIDRLVSTPDDGELSVITREASLLVETWYRMKPFSELFTHAGVNLGAGAERELIAPVVQGMMACTREEKVKTDET